MYTLEDYYNNNIPDDIEYYDYNLEEQTYEKCYEEYELQKDVEALLEERSWEKSFKYIHLRRIAKEAKEKKVSYTLIFKFFKEYEINDSERVWFWMEYYF